ncbi:unnamed protein product [Nyctereutes procyonoides]|uniref:(raccoon dog) hypothetical protein n=1 Tax=Nyctereutes procyonoides TaxID=34880 RepID=A0A811YWH7_NYCPR|nr:unnamed protein product [Nyctereutes procyonoides]
MNGSFHKAIICFLHLFQSQRACKGVCAARLLPWELRSASQPQAIGAFNCVCEHLCFILIYFVHPLSECVLRGKLEGEGENLKQALCSDWSQMQGRSFRKPPRSIDSNSLEMEFSRSFNSILPSMVKHLPLPRVVIPGSWDRVPHQGVPEWLSWLSVSCMPWETAWI